MERADVEALRPFRHHFVADAPRLEKGNAIGDVGGGEQIVRDHQHRRAAIAHRGDQRVEIGGGARVEAGGRLVEQQHRHLPQQRDRDGHLLPHALGETVEPLIPGAFLQAGGGGWYVSYGGVARWRPARTVELTGFFGRYDYGDEEQGPVIFPAGAALPGRVERRLYWGQDWADWAGHAQNGGLIAKASLGKWQIAAGAFQSRFTRDTYHAAYYRDVDARGIGRSVMVAGQDQVAESWSGEIRVSRSFDEGRRRHLLLGSLRGRDVRVGYGGYATVELGTTPIGVPDPQPQPAFAFGPRSRDQVRQTSAAIGYELRWAGLGELNLGLTRSDYRKTIRVPGAVPAGQHDQPWLWNAALAITATARLTLYGAATRGLEESGVAPANAENRGQALPALRTRQMEAGLRYALPGGWRLNAAAFEIAKPYFDIDRRDGA